MNSINNLILLSILFLPFTALRISFFGIGEVLCIIIFVYVLTQIKSFRMKQGLFSKVFLLYSVISLMSYVFYYSIGVNSIDRFDSFVFNYLANIIILLTIVSFETLIFNDKINPTIILRRFFYSLSVIMILLFLLSLFVYTIAGYPLIYAGKYFSPLNENIHQANMVLVLLPFIGVRFLSKKNGRIHNCFIVILIIATMQLSFMTGASKSYLCIFIGVFTLFISHLILHNRLRVFAFFLLVICLVILILNIDFVVRYGYYLFSENDLNSGREHLYVSAINIINEYLLFGRGSGVNLFVEDGNYYMDSHSTILSVLLQTGMIGLLLFLYLFKKIFLKLLKHNIWLLPVFISTLGYVLFGDILRKLLIWIILLLIYYEDYIPGKKQIKYEF